MLQAIVKDTVRPGFTLVEALVALPLVFQPGFSDWNEVWGRALDAAGCRA